MQNHGSLPRAVGLSSQQEAQFQQLAAGVLQPERVDEHVVDNALIRMVHAH